MELPLLCIPSKGRPYDFEKQMLPWVSKACDALGMQWKLFVEPQDAVHYRLVAGKENVIDIGKNDQGIGYAVETYTKYAELNGYKYVFRHDDDARGWNSKYVNDNASGSDTEVLEMVLGDIMPDMEKYPKLGAVRFVSSRIALFEAIAKQRKYTHMNDELWNARIVRTELEGMIDSSMTTGEDAVLTCAIRESGHHILTYGRAGNTLQVNTNKGGFNMMDRAAMTHATYEAVKDKYPFLRVRKNDTWFGVDLDTSEYCPKVVLSKSNSELDSLLTS